VVPGDEHFGTCFFGGILFFRALVSGGHFMVSGAGHFMVSRTVIGQTSINWQN
jgi:hypothetical protein